MVMDSQDVMVVVKGKGPLGSFTATVSGVRVEGEGGVGGGGRPGGGGVEEGQGAGVGGEGAQRGKGGWTGGEQLLSGHELLGAVPLERVSAGQGRTPG